MKKEIKVEELKQIQLNILKIMIVSLLLEEKIINFAKFLIYLLINGNYYLVLIIQDQTQIFTLTNIQVTFMFYLE